VSAAAESLAPERAEKVPLRVAVVSDSTPERNGVGSYYADLVRHLAGRIERAELFCPRDTGKRLHRYLAPPLPGDSTQRIWLPRPFKLYRQVKRLAPHAVIVPTPGPFGIVGMLIARRLGVPLIVGFHTHYEALTDIYWTDFFGRVCRGYLTWCNRLLFRHSAVVLANSPEMIRQAERMGARSAELMGTSVPADFLDRPLAPIGKPPKRLLFAGRLAEEKNLEEVIGVARARPALEFGIAGDGPMREIVEEAARELPNLRYYDWVSREALVDLIDGYDVLLLPSRVESFGTVALEGMARGRLVIVSGACGIAEWPDLEAGLFQVGRDESVAGTVDRVVSLSPAVVEQKSRTAHHAARKLNDWNVDNWIGRLAGGQGRHGA